MEQRELKILSEFRKNARENLTRTARRIKIPISTLHDRLKRYEGNIIQKHTSILDFSQIGYSLKVQMVIKSAPLHREELQRFLLSHPRINSMYSISNGFDFMIELILKNLLEMKQFTRELENFKILDRHEFYIVEDMRREDFLVDYKALETVFVK